MECESSFTEEQDYEARQSALDAAYALEYCRWVETLTDAEKERLTLAGAQEPDTSRRAGRGASGGEIDISLVPGGAGYEGNDCIPTTTAPIPEGTDFDQLLDQGLSPAQAEGVLQWISRRHADEVNALAADRLARFFTLLLPPSTQHKINLSLLGTRALAGLFLMNRNGSLTMSALAQRAGLSKQLLDHHIHKLADAMAFHGFGMKRESTRAVYSEAARQRWAALTPEERKIRRAGKAANSSNDDQHLTGATSL